MHFPKASKKAPVEQATHLLFLNYLQFGSDGAALLGIH
jgi:hypothetical protein